VTSGKPLALVGGDVMAGIAKTFGKEQPRISRANRVRALRTELISVSGAIWVLAALILLVLVVLPFANLLGAGFHSESGGWTLEHFARVFTRPAFLRAIQNTAIFATASAVLAVVVALPMAWLVEKSNMPGRRWVWMGVIGTFAIPPFLGAIAWLLLAGPNAGFLNRVLMMIGFEAGVFNVFSMLGMIWVAALYSYPLAFLFVSAALSSVPADLEDAASNLGAGTWHTIRRVTLPLVLPAILGAFVLTFLQAVALFGIPGILGLPARIQVITTELWQMFFFPPRLEQAAAFSTSLLGITIVLLYVQKRILGRRAFTTITGKGAVKRRMDLGWWKYPALIACLVIVACSFVLPFLMMLAASLMRAWGAGFAEGNFSLSNYQFVLFQYSGGAISIRNSFLLAFIAATAAIALVAVVAYVTERRLVPGHGVLRFLALSPQVIPGIVLAIGLFAAYSNPPLLLYGTIWLLAICYLTHFLPPAYENSVSGVKAVHADLEDAARTLGASRFHSLRVVTLPLIRPALIAGWILVFMPSLRELSSSILLFTSNSRVISVTVYDLFEQGSFEAISVMGVVVIVITLLLLGIGIRFLGGTFMRVSE
jgi:iron(III) transport system permease protein